MSSRKRRCATAIRRCVRRSSRNSWAVSPVWRRGWAGDWPSGRSAGGAAAGQTSSTTVGSAVFSEKLQVAVIGLGPRGLSVAERLCANAESLLPPGHELVIHLVDPHVFVGGRVWRSTQDRLLLMNTVACQVTMFVDETVDCAGPVVAGPSLYEWAR